MPVVEGKNLPSLITSPPLLREHRLYQADWLLRFYGFEADEILSEENPDFNPYIDPKCNWAINHMEYFPVDVNRADRETLLRVPGIGVKSAYRIIKARKLCSLDFDDLKKLGVVMKRASYFITCKGKSLSRGTLDGKAILAGLMSDRAQKSFERAGDGQLSLFDENILLSGEDRVKCLTGQM